jgi:hypothetical protein
MHYLLLVIFFCVLFFGNCPFLSLPLLTGKVAAEASAYFEGPPPTTTTTTPPTPNVASYFIYLFF